MLRDTVWRPDTCGCEVVYAWDDAVDPSVRTHTITRIAHACPAHANLPLVDHGLALFEENPRKNKALAALAEHVGVPVKDFAATVEWTFDAKRVLVLTLRGDASQQADAQAVADTQLGAGTTTVRFR